MRPAIDATTTTRDARDRPRSPAAAHRWPWLALLACALGCAGDERPSLLLVTIDTLRADHLGFEGYARDTSPTLDRLAAEGTWFPRCYAQSATTAPSHATIFTATHPPSHGVRSNNERFPERPSLMSVLRGDGYETAGFVSSVVLGRRSGLDQHFDHFDDQASRAEGNRPGYRERPAGATLAAAQAWLASRAARRAGPAGRPFFLWIHLIDPHGPYQAPVDPDRFVGDRHAVPGRRRFELAPTNWAFARIPAYQNLAGNRDPDFYVARYDAEIRYADAMLGDFFAALRAMGLYEALLLVITADHGETLDEPTHRRYFSHGTIVYDEVMRVPLIVREPGGARRLSRVDRRQPVRSLDIAPTLLDLLGLPAPTAFEGRSLLAPRPASPATVVTLGAYGTEYLEEQVGTQLGLRRGRWRFILNTRDGEVELYDGRRDPGERENLAARQPEVVAGLRAALAASLAAGGAVTPVREDTEADRERLRALGYVD